MAYSLTFNKYSFLRKVTLPKRKLMAAGSKAEEGFRYTVQTEKKDMRLLAIKFAEDEILFHLLVGGKVKTVSLNQRNETTVLGEGIFCEFIDIDHLITTLSLSSPDTLFFRPPITMDQCIYDELLGLHGKDNDYKVF